MAKSSHEPLVWYLEGMLQPGKRVLIPIEQDTFSVGRDDACDLTLASKDVSRRHAEVVRSGEGLTIRDLGSTNGTFVNRERLGRGSREAAVAEDDIVHFGTLEFRVARYSESAKRPYLAGDDTTAYNRRDLPQQFVQCETEFYEMLEQRALSALFEPVARLNDRRGLGHRMLPRGRHEGVPRDPFALLEIAHRLGYAQELTELLQQIGLNKAKVLPDAGKLFVPLYPNEWELRSFIKGMQNVRRLAGDLAVVATIATDVFEDSALMRQIRDTFSPGSGLELAYEGFGASQDQLDLLASAPPEYLLFAPDIVRQLEDKPSATQKRLRNLVKGVKDLKVTPVATGLDTSVTATACQKLGFEYGAGTHLGVPFAPEGI